MSFKRHPAMKHGSRTRIYQLERHSTVDPTKTVNCIMFDGDCDCYFFIQCKYREKLEGGTDDPNGHA